jgi:hypothetical protein
VPTDLAGRYYAGLETQVNVQQTGEQATDKNGRLTPMFTDGASTWYNYRIDSAEDAAKRQTYDLAKYYDSIGISGYDPVRGVAIGAGFDFDSLVGHKAGLSQDRLDALLDALRRLPYVEVRRSTGGSGYHIWVWFDPEALPQVDNRAEHKALARAVLHQMCEETGHDFEADIDCCGSILWICARRATPENQGLSLVREAESPLTDYPRNWREHLEVVKGKRRRTKLHPCLTDEEADAIDDAYRDRPRTPLGTAHRRFIDQLHEVGYDAVWNQDLGCLNTHTYGIKLVKERFGLKGIFDTVSEGNDPAKPNCCMFPLPVGGWRVCRFNEGAREASTWETSPNGWTTCTINETPSLERAALALGGLLGPKKTVEEYLFRETEAVIKLIKALGGALNFPAFVDKRVVRVRKRDANYLIVETDHQESDDAHTDEAWQRGWTKDNKNWAVVVKVDAEPGSGDESPWTDRLVRHVSQQGKQVSLFANTTKGWQQQSTDRVCDFLQYKGFSNWHIPCKLGWCAAHPWELVSIPFESEYPGRRRWNRNGSRLLFEPAARPGETPYWDMVLHHIGRGLDDAVDADEWCQSNAILSGADYLRRWTSIMLQTPARRLPMLFMYSHPEQNTGKSIFHEGLSTLFDENGFTFADKALTLDSGFNAELRGKALCVVEETNVAKSDLAYTRVKAWITRPTVQIHPKGKDAFVEPNYTHWVMTANDAAYLPIEPGDTRIIIWEVTPFEGKEIVKDELLGKLRKEAPLFLQQLFQLNITDSAGRHTLPVLMTAEKAAQIKEVEKVTKFCGLDGTPRMLCEAIIAMPKPFSGNATALNAALGDWDGNAGSKSERSRTTGIGRHMKRLAPVLAQHGISLTIEPGRNSTYHIAA